MITAKDAERALDKIQHQLTIKTLRKLEVDLSFLNLIKNTY